MDGDKTGTNAAIFVAGNLKTKSSEIRVNAGKNIRTVTPHKIVGGDEVEFAIRIQEPIQNAVLKVGEVRKKYRVLSPTQVVKITLKPSEVESCRESGQIEVSCFEKKKGEAHD